ncbi:hypothetical protein I317_05102 [Kwoniella heveanensis CBS 569]|nr:hypothetical protein I317_05102 [Kwoniella heveanensis CBS 569]
MALQRILQAYTGRNHADGETKSDMSRRKGKDKAALQEEGPETIVNIIEPASQVTLSSDPSLSEADHEVEMKQLPNPSTATQSSASIASNIDPSDFPPVISRLLKARLFRLSVFHLLSTPQYATNGVLLLSVANLLEEKGAGKLARRLRRGWEMHQEKMRKSADLGAMEVAHLQREVEDTVGRSMESSVSEIAEDTGGKRPKDDRKLRLWSDPDPKGTKRRLPVDLWNVPPTPPSFSSTAGLSSSMSETPFDRKKSLTTHYNAHLQYLLTRPYLPPSSAVPISSDLISMSKINDFPSPAPNMQQLRRLLLTIRNLEKRGFLPDRQTANIVLKCWLRCSAPAAKHRPKSAQQAQEEEDLDALMGMGGRVDMRSYRMHKNDIDGTDKVVRKAASEKGLRPRELRKLFEVLSGIITSSYPFKSDLDVLSHRSLPSSKPDSSSSPSSASAANLKDRGIDPAILRGSRELGFDANILQGLLDVLEKQEKEQQREYDTVVKPFARMMIRSMRAMGDAKGVERVIGWLQAQKKLLASDE